MNAAQSGQQPTPRSRAFVRWTLRHGLLLWISALVLALPAFWATARLYLHLNSDIEQLLPRESPSVRALNELRARTPGLQYLGVVVDAGDASRLPAAEKFLDDLADRVRAYPPQLVKAVRTGSSEEKRFVENHAALYADLNDLETVRARIAERKHWETAKKLDILLDDEPAPSVAFPEITAKYKARASTAAKLAQGRFTSADIAATLMLVEVGGLTTGIGNGKVLLERVKKDVAALGGPDHYAPGLRLGFTGEVATSLEEISALQSDLTVASLLVLLAVLLMILYYFRWWRSLPILLLPLMLAAAFAFALATLPPWNITELNSNTAFLGSIIIGNGINFGIVLLARYVEARRRGKEVEDSLTEAIWGARLGTLVAALAAGASYASLMVTQFRGFRQFGIIGGMGMVLCWGLGFLLMPPLIRRLDRGPATAPRPLPAGSSWTAPFARWVSAHPIAVVVVGALATLGSLVVLTRFDSSRLETDFSQLRRRDTWTNGEGYWGHKMDDILGRYLSPTVIMTDSAAQAETIANRVRAAMQHPPLDRLISEVRTLSNIVPPDQEKKILVSESIRRLLSPVTRASIDAEALSMVDKILGNQAPSPITVADLPATFTVGMREFDGSMEGPSWSFRP